MQLPCNSPTDIALRNTLESYLFPQMYPYTVSWWRVWHHVADIPLILICFFLNLSTESRFLWALFLSLIYILISFRSRQEQAPVTQHLFRITQMKRSPPREMTSIQWISGAWGQASRTQRKNGRDREGYGPFHCCRWHHVLFSGPNWYTHSRYAWSHMPDIPSLLSPLQSAHWS